MQLLTLDPNELRPNPWNTNHLGPEAELKLEVSIARGIFKPILVRTLEDGTKEILGGAHRSAAACRIGMTSVPVLDLGAVEDIRAKEISIIDNGRYGQDDANALSALLKEIGDPVDLASYMPYDLGEMSAMLAVSQVDLASIGFEDDDAAPVTPAISKATKTHAPMKFSVPLEDQATVEATIKSIIDTQGFDDSNSAVRAGDALVWLIANFTAKP